VKLLLSSEYADAIGRSDMNQIEQRSGTAIKRENKPWDSAGDDTERLFTIAGSDNCTRDAVDLILDKICGEDGQERTCSHF
jgi:hypothetical protein